jgi:DNA-binding IclR family transcriptional regulator
VTESPGDQSPIQVLTKAVRVMDCFTVAHPVLHLSEIRERTGLPTTTCARILRSLVAERLLEREGDHYRAGLRVVAWAASASTASELIAMAGPVLAALRDATEETAGLQVRNGGHRITVALEESRRPIIYRGRVGEVMAMHTGASGKVMMAFDREALDAAVQAGLERFTDRTVTDADALRRQLPAIADAGVAVCRDEREPGLSSVGAPVFGGGAGLVAAISLGVPSFRLGEADEPRISRAVVAAAADLSSRLGNVGALTSGTA